MSTSNTNIFLALLIFYNLSLAFNLSHFNPQRLQFLYQFSIGFVLLIMVNYTCAKLILRVPYFVYLSHIQH
jgi:hypothetical protein